MTITSQTIITAAAVLAAVVAIFKYYNKVYDLVKHQKDQDGDIKTIKKEQTLIIYGVLACLKGMHEQGANGPVTEAIDKIEKHINLAAHDQL
ncbi:MAG: hypothetical protein IJV55_01885 [Paludibacteraceae bacterium]|nr:hypothetical protein [Paludibacteraceae bacterium]